MIASESEGIREIISRVELGSRSYSIRVGAGSEGLGAFARESLNSSWSGRGCKRALFVSDENVAGMVDPYRVELAGVGIEGDIALVPSGEESKCLEVAGGLFDRLISLSADRHTVIVAIGGGVVGDLAGFVASTFARGIPLLMIPTTLLAQVDSSVGGKVGVNRPGMKNSVGAFHQPAGVWIDTLSLRSLPVREIRCGMAEVLKYGVILDGDFFDEVETLVRDRRLLEEKSLARIVSKCCRLKAEVVTRDEREETGLRAVLNFGHTVGHAVETVAGYGGTYLHGEAVAVGMVAEARLAERIGWVNSEVVARIESLVESLDLPSRSPGLDVIELSRAMARDKKGHNGSPRFVLPRRIGQVEMTGAGAVDQGLIEEVLAQMVRP